jgi:formylglycine-generating enzyme required for sulfatase activity
MVWIPGGTFRMGADNRYPEEAPAHDVTVDGFWIDRSPVTNLDFLRFVKATGYITVAERPPDAADYPGAKSELLVPGAVVFQQPRHRVDLRDHLQWWGWLAGASWRHPEGPGSTLNGRERHPVVHVAYADVEAYCAWTGKELPTEAEWERAARGGLEGATYAWGDEFTPRGKHLANTWQGEFPWQNLATDGYERTSPVGAFPPNGYGLYDMIGNVWEWTSDWYQEHGKAVAAVEAPTEIHSCCAGTTAAPVNPAGCQEASSARVNPRGGQAETSYDPRTPEVHIPRKVMKGGSHLCAPNYCQRYRPAARMAQAIDTSTSHLGFRCVVRA